MASGPEQTLTGHIGSIEPNVVTAGLEGAVALWLMIPSIRPDLPAEWRWNLAVYGVVALLGILVLGLAVEGLAGILEYLTTRRLWGKNRGEVWDWYRSVVLLPSSWGPGQRWMWQSPQAGQEFARRRLRLLTSRNTAFVLLVLTVHFTVSSRAIISQWADLLVGVLATALFVFLWLSAHRGWNRAVADAGSIGPP